MRSKRPLILKREDHPLKGMRMRFTPEQMQNTEHTLAVGMILTGSLILEPVIKVMKLLTGNKDPTVRNINIWTETGHCIRHSASRSHQGSRCMVPLLH